MYQSKTPVLQELGFHPLQLRLLRGFSAAAGGAMIVCGPLGNGKSLTLRAIIEDMCRNVKREPVTAAIVGGEDFSSEIENARITKITDSTDTSRNVLERLYAVRSQIVVFDNFEGLCDFSVVAKMVAAGRKVFLAMNSLSAVWVFEQLVEEGVSRNLLSMSGFISGVVCQRLFPALCPECSVPILEARDWFPDDVLYRVQHVADFGADNVRTRGPGCPACDHTGYRGKTVVAEFLMPDVRMLRMVAESRTADYYEYWKSSNLLNVDGIGITLLSHAISKMRQGLLDPVDVETSVGLLTLDMVMADSALVPTELGMLIGADGRDAKRRPDMRLL
jgi:type II secretory ATPase GspE/PulE/Tfp pilus assembly ATPase PilB-like protein